MRQVSIIVLLFSIIMTYTILPCFSAIKGGVNYSIPIDYSKLPTEETETKAQKYFYLANRLQDGVVNEDVTNALFLYNILEKTNPENVEYTIKLGILYDKIDKDRQAKGCFAKAISINKQNPLPYYHYGNFYYKREAYRKALKYYNEAYKLGLNRDYDLLYQLGDIYEKLGDTRSSLKYFNEALNQNYNKQLEERIKNVEKQDSINNEYYSDTRIRN